MTITPIDLDDMDLRPAQEALRHIRTYQITRNTDDLRPIAKVINEIRRWPDSPYRVNTLLATFGVVLGANLDDESSATALDIEPNEVPDVRRITRALGDPSPQAAAVRADTRRQMAQAA